MIMNGESLISYNNERKEVEELSVMKFNNIRSINVVALFI